MAITVHLDVVTPEKSVFSGLVEQLSVTGSEGELGILPGHTALLTSIKPGQVKIILQGGKEQIFYVSGGMLEVQPDIVTILADTIVRAENLDEAKAIEAKEQAEKLLSDKKADKDYTRAMRELAQAAAQIRVIKELRRHRK
ncbi:MAG: F0F1 ATP synthase subunit epsilon [Gammaproteobacteria bacterium]|nr:F0F1 ATP synthase subunit epsilon [Gammaproteobacteria bacterium]